MSRFGLPLETKSDDLPPSRVLGYVSVEGSESFFGKGSKKLRKSSKPFHAKKGDRDSVRHDLEKNGFNIIAESALGISVAAAPGAYEDITGGKLTAKERLMHTESGQKDMLPTSISRVPNSRTPWASERSSPSRSK